MKDLEFPIFKTKIDSSKKFDLTDFKQRQAYFELKAGEEIKKLREYLKNKEYALTLHSGANLTTSYVATDHVHLYFKSSNWEKDILDLRQNLDLKELVSGGNVHIVKPYYKNSVFFGIQSINGFKVASNLQLYLDLYNFKPRGIEHAEQLKKTLAEKGRNFYEF